MAVALELATSNRGVPMKPVEPKRESSALKENTEFCAIDPKTGAALAPAFSSATAEDVEVAVRLAGDAAGRLAATSGLERATLLRTIADNLAAAGEQLVQRAHLETGLPLARLQGELARTTGQLRLFADVVEEGSWVDARIDDAQPERKPLPRADIRSMLRPLGPVAVFGASNFPLAFSVPGGDTASALAAGNPVVVKAHPAHPGTSQIAAEAITAAVRTCGLPEGTFSLLFDAGIEVGRALVQHPAICAVAFTGSSGAGQALMRLAADRPTPIPCFAEMGSTNPLERAAELAQGLQGSFTLGWGQFCTKPGVVFVPEHGSAEFLDALRSGVCALGSHGMLTPGIAARYDEGIQTRVQQRGVEWFAGQQNTPEGAGAGTSAAVFSVPLAIFLQQSELQEEIFGPTTLVVHYGGRNELIEAARALRGHLTATIHAIEEDLQIAGELLQVLETKVGRILFNGYPTGVEVCSAMVHGGPFPASSDARFTSVGSRAMLRFARPVCYQDVPGSALPQELQRGNPLGIQRMVNGVLGRV
jgi:alpha-ketoglutaric semialdehyde dehydrogenase